jgi:C-terminal processing protease CtpA/Prc
MELIMRFLAFMLILTVLASCSDSPGTKVLPNRVDSQITQKSNWVPGEYLPSENFANKCESPRLNTDYQDLIGTYEDENNWIRSWSHETYLWYNELPDIDPSSIQDAKEYFNQIKTSATTNSGEPKDQFHYTQNTEEYIQYAQSGVTSGYGFNYILTQSTPPRKAKIIYSQINSPASIKEIRRGAEIISIDGEALIDGDADIINAGLKPSNPGETHTFVIKDLTSTTTRTVDLVSIAFTENPIHTNGIIKRANIKIGYIVLNTFATASAERQLVETIYLLKQNQIDELIIDLRYNGGGYLDISAALGSMIAGIDASYQTYTELSFNDKRHVQNKFIPFPSTTYGIAKSYPGGMPLPTLDLSRVYIISSNNTASASESLINGLRGIDFEVILIGSSTRGKPYGWLPKDNCGITYSTIQFKSTNAKGFGDYADGFMPSIEKNDNDQVQGCEVYENLKHLLGDENEKMLATAIYHIENDSCPNNLSQARAKPRGQLENIYGEIRRNHPNLGHILQ